MDQAMNNTLVYTLEEVASLLKVKPITVRRLVLRKKLPRLPYSRGIRIPCAAVHRLVTEVAP
jgi:excisionase family DNA binding protein